MLRLLLVDDEPAILRLLRTILELAEFEVQTCASAGEAIPRLKQEKFDLIVTDMRMESVTAGYDVVRAAVKLKPRPVVVILTAFPISPADWKPSGADALIVKGTEMVNLPQRLQTLVKGKAQGK